VTSGSEGQEVACRRAVSAFCTRRDVVPGFAEGCGPPTSTNTRGTARSLLAPTTTAARARAGTSSADAREGSPCQSGQTPCDLTQSSAWPQCHREPERAGARAMTRACAHAIRRVCGVLMLLAAGGLAMCYADSKTSHPTQANPLRPYAQSCQHPR
jgi:hypothetical protein